MNRVVPASEIATKLASGRPGARIKTTLRALRTTAGQSQAAFATTLGVEQSELSRLERRKDHKITTIRRYAEALGGTVDVVITIGDQQYLIEDC